MPRFALALATTVVATPMTIAAGPGDGAPLVVRSSLAPASTVFVREFPGRNDRLVEQLRSICDAAGAELHVVPAGEPYAANHVWLQDTVEFLERVDGSGTVALSANRNRALDEFAAHRLADAGVTPLRVGEYRDAFARGEGGDSWIDWYGNLEASPPNDAWPHGRVLYGVNPATGAQMHPEVVALLERQGLQSPLPLDVGWLTIKHVDEMVSFLPARDGGFVVGVPNPLVAISLLKRLERRGHGDTPMLTTFEDATTVASVLADDAFVAANERLWLDRIEPMVARLAAGVDAERVVGLPVLFQPDGLPRTPNVVNALVLPGRDGAEGHVAMADPNGPLIDGVDAFQAETRERLAMANVALHFVDDQQYHRWSGNVHCATNAIRPIERSAKP
ncbi:MAG: protein-arginine deiminase family protein [Planctomycetota bacterium]